MKPSANDRGSGPDARGLQRGGRIVEYAPTTPFDRGRSQREACTMKCNVQATEPVRVTVSASAPRPAGECPVCAATAVPLDRFRFGRKAGLPDAIEFAHCAACDLVFMAGADADAYRRHYADVRNDGGHVVVSDHADIDVRLQAEQIVSRLPPDFAGTILDFGCGLGRLLTVVRQRLPRATLFGHDVADWLPQREGITFVDALQPHAMRYDVVIMAHVLEHLVTFDALQTVATALAPDGLLYVEVPDPGRYASHPRREFMYYFDRLHVNHFSRRALRRLLSPHGLEIGAFGTHAFRYRDGHYPALFGIAGFASAAANPIRGGTADVEAFAASDAVCGGPSLDRAYRAYRAGQERQAAETARAIRAAGGDAGVVVYGGGDNFWRSRAQGGPLHGLRTLAVVDRQAVELPEDSGPRHATASEALQRCPDVPIVITTSQGAAEIRERLQVAWPARAIFVI